MDVEEDMEQVSTNGIWSFKVSKWKASDVISGKSKRLVVLNTHRMFKLQTHVDVLYLILNFVIIYRRKKRRSLKMTRRKPRKRTKKRATSQSKPTTLSYPATPVGSITTLFMRSSEGLYPNSSMRKTSQNHQKCKSSEPFCHRDWWATWT